MTAFVEDRGPHDDQSLALTDRSTLLPSVSFPESWHDSCPCPLITTLESNLATPPNSSQSPRWESQLTRPYAWERGPWTSSSIANLTSDDAPGSRIVTFCAHSTIRQQFQTDVSSGAPFLSYATTNGICVQTVT